MIVVTLTAKDIKTGPMILTECGMAKLFNGDKLHCIPELGMELLTKYKDNLVAGAWWDMPVQSLAGTRWQVDTLNAGTTPKTAPVASFFAGDPKAPNTTTSSTQVAVKPRTRAPRKPSTETTV